MVEIINDIHLSLPCAMTPTPTPLPTLVPAKALWDTGATNCAITKRMATRLGLAPSGKGTVYHANGEAEVDVYYLNLFLPNHFVLPVIPASECVSVHGNFDFIIGMDIITLGDFSVTNLKGSTKVTFSMPSIRDLDFVEEVTEAKKILAHKPGRNEACPCGSGKKYKHCHGIA